MSSAQILGVALLAFAGAVTVGEGATGATLVLLAMGFWAHRRQLDGQLWREPEVVAPLWGLLVWALAGMAAWGLGGEPVLKPSDVGVWAPLAALPFVVWAARSLPSVWLRRAVCAFAGMLVLASLFGLIQFAFNVRPGESIARVASSVASQGRVPGHYDRSVAGGFYFHRLKMAHVLLLGLGLIFARQLFAELSIRRRLLELVVGGLFAVTMLFTYARGAMLAAAVAAVAVIPFASKRWRVWACLGLLVAGVAGAAVPSVRARLLSSTGSETTNIRALIWSQGVRIIADHPLGVGLGNYPSVVDRYYEINEPHFGIRTYPHNVLLAAWAETGPVGLVGYLFMWLLPIGLCITRLRRPTARSGERSAAAAGLFGLVALLVVGLTHDVLFHKPVAYAFVGLVGLLLAALTHPEGVEVGG